MDVTYITGNPEKAKRFNKNLGLELKHKALDIPELQSLSIDEVVEAKARSAFAVLGSPVIVEDTALTFNALGSLPGPFIKFFCDSMSLEDITSLLTDDRSAYCEVAMAYYDGADLSIVKNHVEGNITISPRGTGGFGWDSIFMLKGEKRTMAELPTDEYEEAYTSLMKPFSKLKKILEPLS